MSNIEITNDKIRQKITFQMINKLVGPDGISVILIKRTVDTVAPIVTRLFKLYYDSV